MKNLVLSERKNVNGKTYILTVKLSAERGIFDVRAEANKMIFGSWRTVYTGESSKEIIKKYFRGFGIFAALDGCDFFGAPIWAIENGLCNYKEHGAQKAAESLRITEAEAVQMFSANDPDYAVYQLDKLGIAGRWASEALTAFNLFEEKTGQKFDFDVTTTKSHIRPLTVIQAEEIKNKIAAGYYTAAAIDQRAAEAEENRKKEERAALYNRYAEAIKKAEEERKIMLLLFDTFGTVDNIIYYSHSNTIGFNWKSYGGQKWEAEQITRAAEVLTAAGVNVAIENKQK